MIISITLIVGFLVGYVVAYPKGVQDGIDVASEAAVEYIQQAYVAGYNAAILQLKDSIEKAQQNKLKNSPII